MSFFEDKELLMNENETKKYFEVGETLYLGVFTCFL